RVVFLIDAYETEPVDGREHGRACTDDDASLSRLDSFPFVASLRLRERGVQDRDPLSEASAEPPDRLRRERDFRNEHDRAQPTLQRGGAGAQVHLGLPAAGRAVRSEEHTSELQSQSNLVCRLLLEKKK